MLILNFTASLLIVLELIFKINYLGTLINILVSIQQHHSFLGPDDRRFKKKNNESGQQMNFVTCSCMTIKILLLNKKPHSYLKC